MFPLEFDFSVSLITE